jgi:formylglycine-generating enzyme required for sulfatase activity
MKKFLLFIILSFAFANAQFFYDRHGESRGAYKDSMEYAKLVELAQRFRGPILVKKPIEGVKPRKNLKKIPQGKIQRTFEVRRDSLRNELWLEVEKNEIVKICVDGPVVAWETSLNSNVFNDSCLVFTVPTLIGVESIKVYLPESDSSRKINLAVGMKYLNFKNEKVLLGYNKYGPGSLRLDDDVEEDPERLISITGSYLVDKYPVTNCEIVQVLWDSIPATSSYKNPGYKKMHHSDWLSKKMNSIRNENCIAHDTVAKTVTLFQAMKYANARSVREGLIPYYRFSTSDKYEEQFLSKGRYIVGRWDFCGHDNKFILVSADETSDGYRLPYYDEWMMLARGGDKKNKAPWGSILAPLEEIQKFARFDNRFGMDETRLYFSEPVGQLLPNGYGLYDMFGLVEEHVLLENDIFPGNLGFPSVRKGGGLIYGHRSTGHTGNGAGFRLVRNIGNNAKWSEVKPETK